MLKKWQSFKIYELFISQSNFVNQKFKKLSFDVQNHFYNKVEGLVHFNMLPCPFVCYDFILLRLISVVACFLLFKNKISEVILRFLVRSTKKIFYDEISFYYKTKIWYKRIFLYKKAKASKWPLVAVLINMKHPVYVNSGYKQKFRQQQIVLHN